MAKSDEEYRKNILRAIRNAGNVGIGIDELAVKSGRGPVLLLEQLGSLSEENLVTPIWRNADGVWKRFFAVGQDMRHRVDELLSCEGVRG